MTARRLPRGLGRRPLVVASLADPRRIIADARRAVRDGADVLEVRADLFPKSTLKPETLRQTLAGLRETARRPLLLTLRIGEEGGGLPPNFREQDRLGLFRAALSHVEGVDVELAAREINRHVIFEAHKRGRFVVASAHDFRRTPSNASLAALSRKARRLKADVFKVAAQPHGPADVERLMAFGARAPFRHKVFIAMGLLGRKTRRDGVLGGAAFAYGHVRKPLAPGQMSVKNLARRVRPPSRKAGSPPRQ